MNLEHLKENLIDVAVSPLFARLERFDDGMLPLMEVLGRVFILRAVQRSRRVRRSCARLRHPTLSNSPG